MTGCWTSSTTLSIGPRRRRCCSSPPPAPNCSSAGPGGVAASLTAARSRSGHCRRTTRPRWSPRSPADRSRRRQTEELIERSGGNPLYAEQYVEALGETDAGAPSLPDTVRAIIAARLDGLPASDRHLLQDAAVIGQVFWPSAVTAQDAEDRLRPLERRQLVRRNRRSSIAGQPEYSFVHALLRDVAYEQIPRAQRMDKHIGAAGWIEALGRPDDHAELLGHHYQQALALSRSTDRDLGPVIPGPAPHSRGRRPRAGPLRVRRSRALLQRRPCAVAAGCEARARPADPPARRWPPGNEVRRTGARRSITPSRPCAPPRRMCSSADLAWLRADVWWMTGDHDRCWDHLNRAWQLVADAPASPVKAQVLAQLVRFDMFAARYDPERVRAALDITEALGLDELRAHVLISAGTARAVQADDEGLDQLMEGLNAARAGNWLWAIARGATNLSTQLSFRGRERESLEALHEAQPAVERMGSLTQRRFHSREPDRAAGRNPETGSSQARPPTNFSPTPSASATTYNDISVALAEPYCGWVAATSTAPSPIRHSRSNTLAWPRTPRSCTTRSPSRCTSTPTPASSTRRASASTSSSASTRLHSVTSVSRWATLPGRRR